MLPYIRLPQRDSQDLVLAADVNLLQSNIDALIGSLESPVTSLLDLNTAAINFTNDLATETSNRIYADISLNLRVNALESILPVGGSANQLLKNNGSGGSTWSTVTESLGGFQNVTTIVMTNQLVNLLPTGNSPFSVVSTTLNANLNADLLDGKHLNEITPAYIGAIPETDKGIANGVATLDSSGLIPISQMPASVISDVFVVASESAMLNLTTAEIGDVAVRTDVSKTFILSANPYSILSNWVEILAPIITTLHDLTDVNLGVVSDKDIIRYNSSTGFYISSTAPEEAPNDGKQYTRKDLGWQELSIGTSTGIIKTSSGIITYAIEDVDYLTPTGDGSQLTGIDTLPPRIGQDGKYLSTSSGVAYWESRANLTSSTGLTVVNGDNAVFGIGTNIEISSGYYLPLDSDKAIWDSVTGKENAFAKGSLISSTGLILSGGTDSIIGSNVTIGINPNLEVTNIQFNTSTGNPVHSEGKLFYDYSKHALSYYNDKADVTINISQENVIPVINKTGSIIYNGSVVYPTGVFGTDITVGLADAHDKEKCTLIGMATHDIGIDETGYVTKFGEVSGLNTSSFSSGDIVYLSDSVPGGFTKIKPTAGGSYIIVLGAVKRINSSTGSIFVDIKTTELSIDQSQGLGFSPSELATISFTDTSTGRTLTITPVGAEYDFYQYDVKYTKATDSIQIPDEEGLFVIYYNLGTLTYTKNPNDGQIDTYIRNNPIVAYVYWNAIDKKHEYLGLEMHKIGMNPTTHAYLHFAFRSRWMYGIAPNTLSTDGSGDLNIHAQFGIDAGAIIDEDLYHSTPSISSTTGLYIAYLSGTSASPVLRTATNSGFSVLTAGTGRLAYNMLSGGNYSLAEVANGDFVCYHIVAVNENNINKRVVSLVGQTTYTSIADARAGAQTEINSVRVVGVVPQEVKAIATFIFESKDTYSNAVKARIRTIASGVNYIDWRNIQIAGSAGSTLTSSVFNDSLFQIYNNSDTTKKIQINASSISTGTIRTLTVPDASGTIIISEGVTAGQTIKGGVLTSEALNLYNNSVDNQGITVEADGTLSTNVSSYENLVTNSNDIPNRKFITDNYEPIVSKGNLTTSTGLTVSGGTGAVIGTGASIKPSTGYFIPTITEQTHWNEAYSKEHDAVTLPTDSGLSLSGQQLSIGTPSSIGTGTTNSVTTNTHTHAISGFEPTLTKGNLTTSTGLIVSGGTGAVIGTGASIKPDSGYFIPTTVEKANWDDAYSKEHTHSNKANLDTINQNLGTSNSPSFAGLTVGTSTGIVKSTSGVLTINGTTGSGLVALNNSPAFITPTSDDITLTNLNRNFSTYGSDTRLFTGIPHDERKKFKISVSYSAPDIVVSLSFVGVYTSFSYYINGKKYTITDLTPFTNKTASAAEGTWFVYISNLNVFTLTQIPWLIYDPDVLLWNFYFNASNNTITWIGEERHTAGRDIFNHARNHAQGAIFRSGFAFSQYNGLTAYSSNTDNNFGRAQTQFSGGSFFDEDILNNIAHSDSAITSTISSPDTDWNLTVNQFLGFTALATTATSATQIVFTQPHTLATGQAFTCMQGNTATVRGTGTITTGATGTTFTTSSVTGMASGDAIVFSARIPIYYIASTAPYIWRKLTSTDFLGVNGGAPITAADIATATAQFNNASAGGFTNMTANRYYPVYIVTTNSIFEPVIAILGQAQSTNSTLSTALTENGWQFQNLVGVSNLGIQEAVPIYRLTYQYNTTGAFNASHIRLVDASFINIRVSTITGSVTNPTVSTLPASAITTDISSFNGILTATETNTQLALDRIDDYAAPKASPVFSGTIGTALTPSQNVETDGSGNLTTSAKATAFNQAFETSTGNIKMDGSVSVGVLSTIARADHIHPTDTSRQAVLTFGNLTTSTGLVVSGGTGAVIGSGASVKPDSGYFIPTITEKNIWDTVANKVGLTGNETVAGIKTFSSFPVTPSSAPTANYEVANKKYVDDNAGSGAGGVPYVVATGSANQITINPTSSTLNTGTSFNIHIGYTNTSTGVTLTHTPTSTSAAVKRPSSSGLVDCPVGSLYADNIIYVIYNGTYFVVLSGLPSIWE